MKQKKKALESPTDFGQGHESEAESHASESASDKEPIRRPRRERRPVNNSNDFRVDTSNFEGKLDLEEVQKKSS